MLKQAIQVHTSQGVPESEQNESSDSSVEESLDDHRVTSRSDDLMLSANLDKRISRTIERNEKGTSRLLSLSIV